MKAVGVLLVIIAGLLVAYIMLDEDGMDTVKRAGENVANGVTEAGRGAVDAARNLPVPGQASNEEEPSEDGAEDNAEETAEPDRPVIGLPGQAGQFRWGTSSEDVEDEITVAFSRKGDGLMLQSRPVDGTTYRYFFGDEGLHQVQVRLTPDENQTVDDLHGVVMEEMRRKYGHLPDSRRTMWADGFTIVDLSLDRTLGWVQLEFRRQRR
jgi:hypothetical protein